MRLKRIRIQNFRSIAALDIELPQVCAIVGPNNSGKSNILEAIKRVLASDWRPRVRDFSEDDVFLRNPDLRFAYDRYQRGEQAGVRKLDGNAWMKRATGQL